MLPPRITRWLLVMAFALVGTRAEAHAVFSPSGPFVGGVKHFFISLDDGLLVLALGIVAALTETKAANRLFLLLPGSWLAAGAIGAVVRVPCPGSEKISAVTLLLAGLWAAFNPKASAKVVLVFAASMGIIHGYFNGSALGPDTIRATASQLLGITVSCLLVALYPSTLLDLCKQSWARIVARVVGSWIAATGLLLLGWSLRVKQ